MYPLSMYNKYAARCITLQGFAILLTTALQVVNEPLTKRKLCLKPMLSSNQHVIIKKQQPYGATVQVLRERQCIIPE